jgi:hypothetical protein
MASLERNLRKDLERAVKKARNVAEAGARQAIAQLGVGEAEAPKHLTTAQRALRNGLRAHGRQLGDRRDPKTGAQVTTRLAQECAYEHWHRMLFARFLAETDLLIEPDSGVAITLEEVQELAREKGVDWLPLASEYAERMLPQIFRKDDPVLDIALPPETRSELEDLLKALPKAVFEADDSLGWVYQFWQAEKKEEVNKSEVKIGADELPSVTQLFTEDYMVLFLLHNTLGAWWAGKVLAGNPGLAAAATGETALRAACKVGDIEWTYLRFVRDTLEDGADGPWRPAAGAFEGWPKVAKDITVLDPCMGSGHFLVFALPILVAFRIAEEGLSQLAAVDAVLKENLFGLEIDPRCTQIAAFNLAFAAWRMVGHRSLPPLNLACSGLAIGVTKAEWLRLAEKAVTAADPAAKRDLLGVEKNLLTVGLEERVKNGLEALYDLFAKAPWLGSLIDPRRAGADIFREGFDKLESLLASVLSVADTDDAREMAVAAQGMAKAAEYLGGFYSLVVTNVPYLGRGKQHETLSSYSEEHYLRSKSDLATCFVERCLSLCGPGSVSALVTPQNWLFLSTYEKLRKQLIEATGWCIAARLGPNAFEGISGEVVQVALSIFESGRPQPYMRVLDAAAAAGEVETNIEQKDRVLRGISIVDAYPERDGLFRTLPIAELKTSPATAITFRIGSSADLLRKRVSSFVGLQTGDAPRWVQRFWEQPAIDRNQWIPFQLAPQLTKPVDGCSAILRWGGRQELQAASGSRIQGLEAWQHSGVIVQRMADLKSAVYFGEAFDTNAAALIPADNNSLNLLRICSSAKYAVLVRDRAPGLSITNQALVNIPEIQPDPGLYSAANGIKDLISSSNPTQWICNGAVDQADEVLQVAVARLLGFRWPRQTGTTFMHCAPVGDDRCAPHADEDGIVCLTALKGELPAEQRLNALLTDAFAAEWSAAKLSGLLAEAGYAGKSLDDWLRDGFFAQHCDLFDQRPFIWHIWDGRRDGFHALINYHRVAGANGEGRRTLEKLIYSYLGDWIDRQRGDQTAGVEGADARLAHAEHLKAELIKILDGEQPYDIFVRWKPLHQQPIGWDPDIDDGVRMNIRPFMTARPLGAKANGACILRTMPKIKWDKDRGKEPNRDKAEYPWFWGWNDTSVDFTGGATFDGNRWNDLHYSRSVKQAARDRHATKAGTKP